MDEEEFICTFCDQPLKYNGQAWIAAGSVFCTSFDAVVHIPVDVALIRAEIEHDLGALA